MTNSRQAAATKSTAARRAHAALAGYAPVAVHPILVARAIRAANDNATARKAVR